MSDFCYLGDMLSAGGCCKLASVTPCKCDKGKFCYLPFPSHQPQSATCGQICVKNVRLHAEDTWAMTAATQNSLWRNEPAPLHWICNVKVRDEFI